MKWVDDGDIIIMLMNIKVYQRKKKWICICILLWGEYYLFGQVD